MDRVELIHGFIRENLDLLLTSPFKDSEYRRRKHQYFLVRHASSRQGNPRDSEIAAETVWFLLRRGQITTKEKLDNILSNGLPGEKYLNRDVFAEALEAQKPAESIIDFSKLGRADFYESVQAQVREQLERELKLQGQSLKDDEAIRETDRIINERMARIAALPSVIDAKEFEEPPKPPIEPEADEKLLWWEKLHLTDDPFKQKEGLYDIEPNRYDSVVVKTSLFQQYIRYMDEVPQELFKNTIIFGEYGSGKTALFQYLKKAMHTRQIDVVMVSLSGYPNFQAFKTAFEEKLADELRELLGEEGLDLSLKDLLKTVGHKEKFKGLVVLIDNLNKLREDTPSALTFLAYLQVYRNELVGEVSGKLGFYVAGALAWRDTIIAEPRYSGSLLRREAIPPITVDQAIEMLNKRLESYYPNPDVKRTVKREFIEQVYKNLVTHNEELTFRKFMERLQIEFENNDFTVLAADPVRIPEEIVTNIRATFQTDLVLKERFRTLLEDKIKVNQENGIFCIRLLIDIFRKERTKRLRDEDLQEDKIFYLNLLEKTGLISRVDEGNRKHSWAVCPELERMNKAIATKYSLSLDDYLLKIYGIPEARRRRINEELEQIKAFAEECEQEPRNLMLKILALHSEISETLENYTEKTTKQVVLRKCVESLDSLTRFFVIYVEYPDEPPSGPIDVMFWKDFWKFPEEVAEFQNRLADEKECLDHIWNTVGSYNQAFKTVFKFVRKEYNALSSVHISSEGLNKGDAESLVNVRDQWASGRSEASVVALDGHMLKKTRVFVQNIMTLVYGDLPNRVKHMDAKSREKIQAAIEAGELKRGVRVTEADLLSLNDLVRLMTSSMETDESCWENVFKRIFQPTTIADLSRYKDALQHIKAKYEGTRLVPGEEAPDLREVISASVDLTRKMNAGYSLLLKSLYLEPESTGTKMYFSLSNLEDKPDLPIANYQPNVMKTLIDGMSSGWLDLEDPNFVQRYYSNSLSYREFYLNLALVMDQDKVRQFDLTVTYSIQDTGGGSVYLKRVFNFSKEHPPRVSLAYFGEDGTFAARLANDLRENGAKVWTDDFSLKEGDPINPTSHEPPKEEDHLGIVLSQSSVVSDWVKNSLTEALVKQLDAKRIKLHPVLHKKCDVPAAIAGKKVIDFVFDYRKGLESLLESIEESTPIPDLDYNKRIDVVGQKIGDLLNMTLVEKVPSGWMKELLDQSTFFKAKDRLRDKVPEDPRTEAYQFLTLGELKVLLKLEKVWSLMRVTFVNVKGSSNPMKFNSDELFFGSFDMLMAYRNPPSHGVVVPIAKGNLEFIQASLFKLESILGIPTH